MTALQYVFGLASIILKGIGSVVFILIGMFLFALIMGNGGPSESFLINFAFRICMFLIGALCLGFGISIYAPKSGTFFQKFFKKINWIMVMVIIMIVYFFTLIIFTFINVDFGQTFAKYSFLPIIGFIFFCLIKSQLKKR